MSDTNNEDGTEIEEPEWPNNPLERYDSLYMDFRTAPDQIRSDRDYWDHNYRSSGELGRISIDVQFIGEDGFYDHFEYIVREPREILPDEYGGIKAAEDASGDYVAFSKAAMEHSPEEVDDAMAVARDPLVAAAALRAWYDKQFGRQGGNMVFKNDHWDHQWRREEEAEWKDEGIDIDYEENDRGDRECESCSTLMAPDARVWSYVVPPGRNVEGICTVCARSKMSSAEDDGYEINGPDPREHAEGLGVDS